MNHQPQGVLILDFGAQYTQLIARRVREANVYCEVVPYFITPSEIEAKNPVGLILSGGPASVLDPDAPHVDPALYALDLPILGICYGMQLTAKTLGGKVERAAQREYGRVPVTFDTSSPLFAGMKAQSVMWMSHTYHVTEAPAGFTSIASSDNCAFCAMGDPARRIYCVQFHPEVTHSEEGGLVLRNFLYNVCGCVGDWTMDAVIDQAVASIRARVGETGRVMLGLSGGVDSSVAAALISRAIGDRLTCVYVDHGFMRKGETESVRAVFTEQFPVNLIVVDAKERFLSKIAGVSDPETKRKLIGAEFVACFADEAKKLQNVTFLAQGTIYPDVIESGSVKGSAVIKSHHNVGGLPDDVAAKFTGGVVEPLRMLFKDEVRRVGETLGMPHDMVWRQPFPGPGLAIRVIGDVTEEKLQTVRESDAILREEIAAAGLERDVNQYFTVLTNTRTVGVMGDERTHDFVLAIRAVTTDDFMTVDWARLPHELLARVSARIVNEVPRVNRIVYDITTKPPATVEWEWSPFHRPQLTPFSDNGGRRMKPFDRKLVLEDGSVYPGYGFGSRAERVCEVVFNTSMTGYQEIVSDPSYTDQFVVMTYPLIGNYGITDDDFESKNPSIGGMIVRDYNDMPSNFRYTRTLSELLEENDIPGLSGIDTRMLTRSIRDFGARRAVITDIGTPVEDALALLRSTPVPHDAVSRVACKKRWYSRTSSHRFNVVAVDCGVKLGIIRSLNRHGCNVTIVPPTTTAEEIEFMNPDGVFLSNGPGDPQDVTPVIELIRRLRGKYPMFGICLGHQMIALAYGASTYKLKFGHRGGNHPVKDLTTGKIEMTSQNHSYAVDAASVEGTPLEITHINLLDHTVEGMACPKDRVFSVQYHPESAPGPQDSDHLFDRFIAMMEEAKTHA